MGLGGECSVIAQKNQPKQKVLTPVNLRSLRRLRWVNTFCRCIEAPLLHSLAHLLLFQTKDIDGLNLNENMIKKPGVVEVFPAEEDSNQPVTSEEASGFTAFDMSEAFRLMRTLVRKFNELITSTRKL